MFHTRSPLTEEPHQQLNHRNGHLEESLKTSEVEKLAENILDSGISLNSLENAILKQAMKRFDENVSQAARALGLTRPAMAYRLKNKTDVRD